MSTIYTFHRECPALATPAGGDRILVHDASANLQKDMTLTVMSAAIVAGTSTGYVGVYGNVPVQQQTFTATALSALATNSTLSASNTGAGVFGWSSSTVANAYVTRIDQMQVDLENLMVQVNSTGLVSIDGV